jgi:hypothetical protein
MLNTGSSRSGTGIDYISASRQKQDILGNSKEAYKTHWTAEYKTEADEEQGDEALVVGSGGCKTPWKQFKENSHGCGKQGHFFVRLIALN